MGTIDGFYIDPVVIPIMSIASISGTWVLIASTAIAATISFIEEEPTPNGVKEWLNGTAAELVDRFDPIAGLTLSIDGSGRFTETSVGNPLSN